MNTLVASPLEITSPTGQLQARVTIEDDRLTYSVHQGESVLIEPSPIGVTVDGVDLGLGVEIAGITFSTIDETYPTRGWHTLATNRARVAHIELRHTKSGQIYHLETRLFDDGFALRTIVPGSGTRRVTSETTAWTIPAQSEVWLAERNNNWKLKSYAGWWIKTGVDNLPTISSQGPVQTPPLVVELPQGGFLALTEAALTNYSGLRFRALGERRVCADFWEGDEGFEVEGEIVTPWRVTMWSPDLNGLVNSDILTNLNPPPAPGFYPDLDFIRPGRSVWRWWSSDTGNPQQEKQYVDYAAQLGFEYSLVDDGWEAWPNKWDELRHICDFGKEKGVAVLAWKDYKDIADPADNWRQMREFLDGLVDVGIAGTKIDFMNAESKDRIDFQMAALRETASRRLMLFFHGCQKPSGESRTYPHEMTREGIRGLELNKMAEGPIQPGHNAALPFTRYLTGHADYTPVGYSNPGPTTFAHQLATAIIFTSPMQVIADDPTILLHDERTRPALDILQSIPSVWDETRVLEPSRIGELAIFARRSGTTWFLGAISGEDPVRVPLLDLSFLDEGDYQAVLLSSHGRQGFERVEEPFSSDSSLLFELEAGDGFVARFSKK